MTAFICAVCLAAAPMAGCGEQKAETKKEAEVKEETAEVAEEAEAEEEIAEVTEEAEAEEETAEVTEEAEAAEETTETVEADVPAERPDYTALDYVTLGDYKNLTVTVEKGEVTDEMVEEETEKMIDQLNLLETFTEGKVQDCDIANIDYEGKKDGVAFDGGTAAGHDLTIGSGAFIDGFEEGLIGVEVGSTVDLELTFPEEYHSADLAGQTVIFTVTVNSVKRMPEVTDELINTATNGEYKDREALKAYARTSLEDAMQLSYENEIIAAALAQVCETSAVEEYPEELKAYAVADTKNSYVEMAAMYGVEFSEFLTLYFGVTEEEFDVQINSAVEDSLLKELCIKGIAESEGMEVTNEEYEEGCTYYAEQYGYADVEAFIEYVGGENVVKISLLIDEVYEYFLETVKVEAPVEEVVEETTEAETEAVEETAEVETTDVETETAEEAEVEETETEEEKETTEKAE